MEVARCALYPVEAWSELEAAGIVLRPVAYAAPWNGWAVPVVTASEFTRFITCWRGVDPNGSWGEVMTGADTRGRAVMIHVPSDADERGIVRNPAGQMGLGVLIDRAAIDGVDLWEAGEGGTYEIEGWAFTTRTQRQ